MSIAMWSLKFCEGLSMYLLNDFKKMKTTLVEKLILSDFDEPLICQQWLNDGA